MKSLLIDVGSTFIKYSIYDSEINKLEFFDKIPFPTPIVNDGINFVVDRKNLCDNILQIFEKSKGYDIKIALFSVQMHGYVASLLDGSLTEYISWRDKSGNVEQDKFKGVNFNKFGLSIQNNLPVTKIDCSTVKEFYTLGSYISYFLTGNNATHITDTFASGFYYSPDGVPNEFALGMIMPKSCSNLEVVGEYNGIKILCPFGDHQISFLGSGAKSDAYLINIGTGAQVCCIAPYQEKDDEYQKRPYFDKETCLYTFCELRGIDGNSRNQEDFIIRLEEAISKLPKKQSVIVAGGGGEEVFSFIKASLSKLNLTCTQTDFNVGMQGLIYLVNEYLKKQI